jgi:hypothetical protein
VAITSSSLTFSQSFIVLCTENTHSTVRTLFGRYVLFSVFHSSCLEKLCKSAKKIICLNVKLQVLRQLKAGEHQVDAGTSLTFVTSTIVVVVLTKEVSGSIMVPNNL